MDTHLIAGLNLFSPKLGAATNDWFHWSLFLSNLPFCRELKKNGCRTNICLSFSVDKWNLFEKQTCKLKPLSCGWIVFWHFLSGGHISHRIFPFWSCFLLLWCLTYFSQGKCPYYSSGVSGNLWWISNSWVIHKAINYRWQHGCYGRKHSTSVVKSLKFNFRFYNPSTNIHISGKKKQGTRFEVTLHRCILFIDGVLIFTEHWSFVVSVRLRVHTHWAKPNAIGLINWLK